MSSDGLFFADAVARRATEDDRSTADLRLEMAQAEVDAITEKMRRARSPERCKALAVRLGAALERERAAWADSRAKI